MVGSSTEVRLEVNNMVAVLPEAGLEACLGAYSVVVDRYNALYVIRLEEMR